MPKRKTPRPPKPQPCRVCGSKDATLGPSPYAYELFGDKTPVWMCDDCRRQECEEV